MNKWIKRGDASSVEEAIAALSQSKLEQLQHPSRTQAEDVVNLSLAACKIIEAIDRQTAISIAGDYDADGVCATAIMFLALQARGCTPRIRLPKRISEGYGLSVTAIDELPVGLIVTVDNGICAHEAIQKAKEKGDYVIVLDHHLAREDGVLPNADIIVDPAVQIDGNSFHNLCGAGLALKMAELLLYGNPIRDVLLPKLVAIAAVATIADVVPLVGENRWIVQQGIINMNSGKVTCGMASLLAACGFAEVTEGDIAFKLAPILNAPGRLIDDGAKLPSACLAQDKKQIPGIAEQLRLINEERKQTVEKIMRELDAKSIGVAKAPIVVCGNYPEGIVGILAGKLAEKYKMPAFVLSENSGELKGSGRSFGDVHLKNALDAAVKDEAIVYGGHAGAVGVKLPLTALTEFISAMQAQLSAYIAQASDVIFYDIELSDKDAVLAANTLRKYAPFGESVPAPIVMMKNIRLVKNRGSVDFFMGAQKQHVKLNADGFSLLGFGMADEYRALGNIQTIDAVGKLNISKSKFGTNIQLELMDFQKTDYSL